MKIISCTQGHSDWFYARCGRVTASEAAHALSFLKRNGKDRAKGEESAARASYKARLAAEILSGEPDLDGFKSEAMERGNVMEPIARTEYEEKFGVSVDRVGFIVHPSIDRFGASPDGLVGSDGGLELKCPKTATHIDYMLAGMLPPEYEPQVMTNMACAGREWWDFVSFDNRLPQRHQLFIKRVYRDDARIAEIEAGVRLFLEEVDELIASLNKLNPELTQAERVFGDFGGLGITDADIEWAKQQQGL